MELCVGFIVRAPSLSDWASAACCDKLKFTYPVDWKHNRFFSILSRMMSIKSFRLRLFKHSSAPSTELLLFISLRKLFSLPTDKLLTRAWHVSWAFCFRARDFRNTFRVLIGLHGTDTSMSGHCMEHSLQPFTSIIFSSIRRLGLAQHLKLLEIVS